MRDEQLQQLLRDAATRLESTSDVEIDLAGQVRALDRQFWRRRKVVGGGIACLAIVIGAAWSEGFFDRQRPAEPVARSHLSTGTKRSADPVKTLAALNSELEDINSELRISERAHSLAQRDQKLSEVRRVGAQDTALDDFRMQVDLVASQMLQRAEELREAMDPGDEAIVMYRKLIELFPGSRSAKLAHARLVETSN